MRQQLDSVLFAILFGTVVSTRADWPDFRGPNGDGNAVSAAIESPPKLPLKWSEAENVTWKVPIPLRGWSTPVVGAGRIWLTTATPDGHDFYVLCTDESTGKIVFNERLFHSDTPEPLGNELNCYASPSATVEAGRVYVHFGSYGTACLDSTTCKVIWKRTDLECRHYRGPGSSLILHQDLLILSMDGVDVQYLAALDKFSGKTVWRTERTADWNDLGANGKPMANGDYRKAFSTPLIVNAGGTAQMLSAGSKAAYAYDPLTGREIWKVRHTGHTVAARPIFYNGIAIISSGNGKAELLGIRPDGKGDVTDTHVVWRSNRGVPRMPSPVAAEGLVFMVTDGGIGTCLDAATGEQVWQERLGGAYAASLLRAADRVYYFDQSGRTTVARVARVFEVLAVNQLEEGFMASPAVSGNALILRTKTHLYRVETERVAGR